MFLVFSRERISTYIVSYSNKLVPIYEVQTDEKKIAFTMNCVWKQLYL